MLITSEYREQQRLLHENSAYGVASVGYAPLVAFYLSTVNCCELLDYGCGKGRLAQTLNDPRLTIHHYDPAIAGWDDPPAPCNFVACIDVLEHIEPGCLVDVLDDLQRVTRKYGLFTVATRPAVKTLPDGRNAHLIVEPYGWWEPLIKGRWDILHMQAVEGAFFVFVRNKNAAAL